MAFCFGGFAADGPARGHIGVMARVSRRAAAAIAVCFLLANCASSEKFARKVDPKYGVTSSPRVVDAGQPVPKGGGTYRVGKPYMVAGRTYTPEDERGLHRRRHGLLVWRRFPRPPDRQWRSLRHERDLGRASDVADAVLCARHQSRRTRNPSSCGSTTAARITAIASSTCRTRPPSCSASRAMAWRGCASIMSGAPSLDGSDDRKLMATLAPGRAGAGAFGGARRLGQAVCRSRRATMPACCAAPVPVPSGAALLRSGRTRRRRWPTAGPRPTCPRPASFRGEPNVPPVVSAYAAQSRAPAAFVSGRGLY